MSLSSLRDLNPIIVIPARMAATRLPNKPLADIEGQPMIVHVWRRAIESGLGRVVVACSEMAVQAAIMAVGGEAVLTNADLPSGSDRILAAVQKIDPEGRHRAVINVQGDLPTLDPHLIITAAELLLEPGVDIATLAAIITRPDEINNPNIVKAVAEIDFAHGARQGRALYFTRTAAPSGDGPLLHHIGLYAYHRNALERFVASLPSVLERRENLEQLRALSLGLRIDLAVVDTVPLGVDTPADLERARALLHGSAA